MFQYVLIIGGMHIYKCVTCLKLCTNSRYPDIFFSERTFFHALFIPQKEKKRKGNEKLIWRARMQLAVNKLSCAYADLLMSHFQLPVTYVSASATQ